MFFSDCEGTKAREENGSTIICGEICTDNKAVVGRKGGGGSMALDTCVVHERRRIFRDRKKVTILRWDHKVLKEIKFTRLTLKDGSMDIPSFG